MTVGPSVALAQIAHAALAALYPSRCVACGRFGIEFCELCRSRCIPATGPGRCRFCAAAWTDDGNCFRCASWAMVIDGGFAAYEMAGPARQLVHALKYRRIRTVVPMMAAAMADIRDRAAFDVAMPVPLHRSRQRKRGFNQAAVLVDELGWPPGEGRLLRRKNTESQVGMTMHQRRGNVAGAFVYEGPLLNGARVALVDDVVTTGSTIVECARVLREHGAGSVIVISFARANYQPGTTPDD